MYEPYGANSLRPEQFCSTVAPFNRFAVNDRVVFDWGDSGNSEFGGQRWGSLEASTIGNRGGGIITPGGTERGRFG